MFSGELDPFWLNLWLMKGSAFLIAEALALCPHYLVFSGTH